MRRAAAPHVGNGRAAAPHVGNGRAATDAGERRAEGAPNRPAHVMSCAWSVARASGAGPGVAAGAPGVVGMS